MEPILQALVRQGILKGLRGPRGGYELARERRRITAGDIVRVVMTMAEDEGAAPVPQSRLVERVIEPAIHKGSQAFLQELDAVTVDDLCRQAAAADAVENQMTSDFTI
jgi:DNA-binding IscR family transcriptional regulator